MGLDATIASSAATSGLGLLSNWANSKINLSNAKELQDDAYNKQLDLYNRTYKDQSYKSQVEQMEEAGLSKSLMYSNGASGGGSGNASSVNMGSAASQQGSTLDIMGARLQEAQIKLVEADAQKAEAEANKIKGVDTNVAQATYESILAGTENTKVKSIGQSLQNTYQELLNEITESSIGANMEKLQWEVATAQQNYRYLQNYADISIEMKNEIKEKYILDNRNLLSNVILNGAKTNLTKEQADNIAKELELKTQEIQQRRDISDEDRQAMINKAILEVTKTPTGFIREIMYNLYITNMGFNKVENTDATSFGVRNHYSEKK